MIETKQNDNLKLNVLDQVETDLKHFLLGCKNIETGLVMISRKSGLHVKTLQRILDKKNRPSYQTILKLYSVFLNTDNVELIKNQVPQNIRTEIDKNNPNRNHPQLLNLELEKILSQDQLSLMIYTLLGSGPLSENEILQKFGDFGLITTKKLVLLNAVDESPKHMFRLSKTQVNLTPDLLAKISKIYLEHFFRPEQAHFKTENYIGLMSEGINHSTYQKILEMDRLHFEAKLKLLDDPSNAGTERFFSIQIVEKISTD